MRKFEVGGCVRDEILGIPSKDIDFSVVLEPGDLPASSLSVGVDPYEVMVANLESEGVTIFRNKDTGVPVGAEHLTARGRMPGRGAVDFVLARREGTYSDGRRPDSVEPGTLMDDLRRRDFTMNAIAKDEDGNFVDPFGGEADIHNRVIRAVGSAFDRLNEDALRAVRAVRFSVMKGFRIDHELAFAMRSAAILDKVANPKIVAAERIEGELSRMFAFDPIRSMTVLMGDFPALTGAMLSGRVSLTATLKEK